MVALRPGVVMLLLAASVWAAEPGAAGRHDVGKMQAAQKKYLATLDVKGFAADYPKVIRDLDATGPKTRQRALAVVGATMDLRAVPLVIPMLKDPDGSVRVFAALALNNVTVQTALERRDQKRLYTIALNPLGPDDPDMRPLAAVVLEMLQSEDPNIVAAAAIMAGYLQVEELEPELRELLKSKHETVKTQARQALDVMIVSRVVPGASSEK